MIGLNHSCILSTHVKTGKIFIDNKCGLSGTTIGIFLEIKLGDNVQCGANTLITDSDWHLHDERVGPQKSIVIEDNVWLGYGVIVLKGVTIGENSIMVLTVSLRLIFLQT